MLQHQSASRNAYQVHAAWSFIRTMHREGIDQGLIATFGDTFRIETDFTTSISRLATTLNGLAQGARNEGTLLYDSIENMVNTFWRAGRRDSQWILLINTDGDDNRSQR